MGTYASTPAQSSATEQAAVRAIHREMERFSLVVFFGPSSHTHTHTHPFGRQPATERWLSVESGPGLRFDTVASTTIEAEHARLVRALDDFVAVESEAMRTRVMQYLVRMCTLREEDVTNGWNAMLKANSDPRLSFSR